SDAGGGDIDLGAELEEERGDLGAPPELNPQVREALDKLRDGTREGLTQRDHYDRGVAYLEMGLVDDAVREFVLAGEGEAPHPGSEDMLKNALSRKAKGSKKTPGAKKPGAA